MDKEKYYKYMFIIGAFFNWINSLTFFILSLVGYPSIFDFLSCSAPPTLFFLHSLLGLIATFGIGYFIVGLNIHKNHAAVTLGIISKLWFFTMCLIYTSIGQINILIAILGLGDFIFAILFIEFFVNYRKLKN